MTTPTFHAYDFSLDLVRSLRAPLATLARHDPSLVDQLRRAAASVPLNVAEGNRRAGRDRTQHFRVAAGSAAEVRACLHVAEAFGYVAPADIESALGFSDRVLGILWRLTH